MREMINGISRHSYPVSNFTHPASRNSYRATQSPLKDHNNEHYYSAVNSFVLERNAHDAMDIFCCQPCGCDADTPHG